MLISQYKNILIVILLACLSGLTLAAKAINGNLLVLVIDLPAGSEIGLNPEQHEIQIFQANPNSRMFFMDHGSNRGNSDLDENPYFLFTIDFLSIPFTDTYIGPVIEVNQTLDVNEDAELLKDEAMIKCVEKIQRSEYTSYVSFSEDSGRGTVLSHDRYLCEDSAGSIVFLNQDHSKSGCSYKWWILSPEVFGISFDYVLYFESFNFREMNLAMAVFSSIKGQFRYVFFVNDPNGSDDEVLTQKIGPYLKRN